MPPVNGSSPSLGVDFAQDFLAEEDKKDLNGNAAGTSFAKDFLAEQDSKLGAAARWSRQFDPEAYAKAAKLVPGVAPEIGVRQLKTAEDQARLSQFHQLFEKAPGIGSYFAENPKDLAFANPDELDRLSGINWAINAAPAAFISGVEQTQLGLTLYEQMAGNSTPENDLWADTVMAKKSRTFGNHGDWLSSGLVNAAQSLPSMIASVLGGAYRGSQGGIVGGAAGSVLPGVGTAAGAVTGFGAGAAYGSVEQQIKIQAGLAYAEFKSFRDETGAPLDPTVAKWAALLAGTGAGGLEALGLKKTIGQIPGVDKLLGALSVDGMKAALRVPGFRSAITNFAKNLGTGVSTEILTEVGQEGLTILAGELAKVTDGNDFQMLTSQEITGRMVDAGVAAAQVMTLLGPVTSGTRFAADLQDMKRTKSGNDKLRQAAAAMEDNGLIERAPDVAAKVIDQMAPDQKLYIPARQMAELFQTEERDVMEVPIQNWRERMTEALATDDDVEVTVGEFIAHLGKDPKNNPLFDLTKTDPRDYVPKDIKEYSEALDELMGSELVKAEKKQKNLEQTLAGTPPDTRVKDALKEQIKATGFTESAAESYATVLSAYVMTKARQLGVDPVEWATTNGVLITREDDPMIGSIREMNERDERLELYQPAWHGSPHEFDQFSLDAMGTGEGAQAFGWGLYFAGDRKIAEGYRNRLSRTTTKWLIDGELVSPRIQAVIDVLAYQDADKAAIISEITDAIARVKTDIEAGRNQGLRIDLELGWLAQLEDTKQALEEGNELRESDPKGRLYQVDLPEDETLAIWDMAIKNQTQLVRDAFAELGIDESMSFEEAYYEGTANLAGKEYAEQADEKTFSQYLRDRGIKGHKFLNGDSRNTPLKQAQPENFNYVIYDDTQIKVVEYFQDQRGSITFQQEGPALIKLFNKADMSTLLHEAGHFFLQTTRDLADQSPEIMADWEVLKKHLKIGDDNKITREQHEQFAKMAEAYFMEGKAPTPELRQAFAMFRQWLKVIYRSITKLGGKVHPEIAAVFDNMLRAERAVETQSQDSPYSPLFKSAEEMGVDPAEYLEYQRLAESLRSEAQDSIIGRVVGQQKTLQKGWRGEVMKELVKEAEVKLKKLPPYSHIATMKETPFSINTEAFEKKYGKASAAKFPRSAFNKTGLDPEVAANLLGYSTADEMVYDFVQAPSLKEAAKISAEQEMLARYGDDMQNQQMLDLQVKRALAEEGRLVLLGKELQILNRKAGVEVSEKAPRQIAQEIARSSVYSKKFKDVKEGKTHALVGRLARMAETSIVRGKWQEAADFKRKQLLAAAIDTETQRVNKAIEKIRDKAARYTRTAPKGIDPSAMEQIRDLVTKYEFVKISGKKLNRRMSLAAYLQTSRDEGLSPIKVPERLLRDVDKVNYKELTVEDLLGFGDTLDNLEHMGRLKHKLRTAKNNREFGEIKGTILRSISRRKERTVTMQNYGEEKKAALDGLWRWTATLLKPEKIVEWLDLGDIAGPMQEFVFNPIAEAQTKQNELSAQYNEKLTRIFEKIDSSYMTEVVKISSLNTTMTRQQIYATALNTGNISNLKKLMEGHKWSDVQLAEILSHMKKDDWDRVQSIWNTLDGLWEHIAAMEKRLTGVAPPRIEAQEFTNIHGTYAGGYYPVIYDFKTGIGVNQDEDQRPIDQQNATFESLFGKPFIPPGTSHAHTYKRTAVAKVIKLNLGVLPSHMHQVIHDLAYREPVRTAYKLLWDPDIKAKISAVESEHVYDQLTHWLRSVAAEKPFADDPTVSLVERARVGATIYGMGFRFTTIASQPLGLFSGAKRTGLGNMLSGLIQFGQNPRQSLQMVNELSGELRHRFNAQDRDIKSTIQNAALQPDRLKKLAAFSLAPIGAIDKVTATVVWLAGYKKAIDSGLGQDLAIQSADRDVRLSQGTGNAKDLAKIMSSGEINRLFTMFYSAFSAQYNEGVDLTRQTKRDISEGEWADIFLKRLPEFLMLVVIPAVFGALITGQGPEEDENKIAWAAKKIVLYPIAGIPFVRDIVGQAATGFDYKLSPAGKMFEESSKGLEKLFDSEKDWPDRIGGAIKPLVIAGATWYGLPAGQPINSIEGLYYGLVNHDLDYSDLLFGRRDKPR